MNGSEFHQSLPLSSTGYLDFGSGGDTNSDELESTYADDLMHGVLHPVAACMVQALAFSVWALQLAAEQKRPRA